MALSDDVAGGVQGDHADVIMDYITKELGQGALKDPTLVKQIALAVLRHAVQNPKVTCSVQGLVGC